MREKQYWFPARPASNGWKFGWGLPTAWQGWAVYAVFILSLIGGQILLAPFGQLALVTHLCGVIALLVAVTG
ncbi:MAG: hypothetical protein Q8R69_20105 [Telluria sp.]|nr:hypothetical protein [Telluria sp.]